MIAVIKTGGKQYLVTPGQTITIEKLGIEPGKPVTFNDVLLISDQETQVGKPKLKTAVTGTVVANGKGKKVVGIKFHNKVRYKRTKGHRQEFTKVKIEKIG